MQDRDVDGSEGKVLEQVARDVEVAVPTGYVTQLPAVTVITGAPAYPESSGYTTNRADNLWDGSASERHPRLNPGGTA
ncbi:MAG: hypothetical protein P0107_02455 [Nitrosomonas sp.]|nr:hypothetical protein [Nitrosomonas sp.]